MPTNFFGTVRQKLFDGKTWYPLVCIKFFDTAGFLKHWRDAHEIFRPCETKNFRRKLVISPIMQKIFRYPKFSETLKGCPRNFLALWDIKISTEIRDMPPLIHKFFSIPEIFPKTRVPLQSFSFRSSEKKSSEKTVMPPSYAWKFSIKEIFWNIEGMPTKFFGTVRQKVFDGKTWYPLYA